jgi:hypothetical protein
MPTNGQFAVGEILTAANTNTLLSRGYQNRIINGAFEINQRGYASGTNLASGAYGFDRWKSGYTNTSLTFTDGVQATTVTISSSGVIQQIVEQANIPAGTYTLSWTGTATGRVYNSGGSAPSYAASPVTVTLNGSANVVVEFTASGSTKTLGTVQLEGGTVYSPFEYRQRADELALCYRYYYARPYFLSPLTSGGFANSYSIFQAFPTEMRRVPDMEYFSGSNYTGTAGRWSWYNGGATSIVAVTVEQLNTQGIAGILAGFTATLANGSWRANGEI